MSTQRSGLPTSKKICVLVVDDDGRILRFLDISLKMAGYKVVVALNGEEALRLQESERPDVVLLDIFMPGMSGIEVLRKLRTVSKVPVIAFSAHATALREALQAGANDFLAKPFIPEELIQRIKVLMQ